MICINSKAQQPAGTFAITPKVGVAVSNFSGNMPVEIRYAKVNMEPTSPFYQEIAKYGAGTLAGAVGYSGNKSKTGFTAGVECQYQFTSLFGLSLGVMYTQEGAKYDTPEMPYVADHLNANVDNLKINLDCITLPVLANFYIWKGLALKAGIQPEFAVSRKVKGDFFLSYDGITNQSKLDSDANVKSFFFSVPVGLSYEYKNVVADFRYCFGLTNLKKQNMLDGSNNSSSARSQLFTVTLGYKFEL